MANTGHSKPQVFDERFYRIGGGKITHINTGKTMDFVDYFKEQEKIIGWKKYIIQVAVEAGLIRKEATDGTDVGNTGSVLGGYTR